MARRPDSPKAPAKAPAKAKAPARKGRAAPSPSRGVGGVLRALLRHLFRLLVALVVGTALGGAIVSAGLYRDALDQVRARLAEGLWQVPGKVWSGPIEVWAGLTLTPEELAQDLIAAGYVRAASADRPGDFSVGEARVTVYNAARKGPGWQVDEEKIVVGFADGRVKAVSPRTTARFPARTLASLRGESNEERTVRALEDFPKHLRLAVLAMEDARFYEHGGVSGLGILRALYVNLRAGETVQGGSTLTQQVAKNLFLSQERSLMRKVLEVYYAAALEHELTKDELLALYLNEIYWGQSGSVSICGADQASRAWFSKPVERIGIGEAATLAGVISSPNAYSPLRHPDRARERRDLALRRMVEEGWLTEDLAQKEAAQALVVSPQSSGRTAPYAVDAAVEASELLVGAGRAAQEGLNLYTAIQPPVQRLAERAVASSLAALEESDPDLRGVQMALVAVRPSDGAVVALVGGRDYASSQFNRALLAARQVGSTVKPLTMLAAFEADPALLPLTLFEDEPIERTVDGKTWRPANYDGAYVGPITLREAMADSRNIPAVLLSEQLGLSKLQSFLRRVGLEDATRLPSVALGAFEATPLQLAGAYTALANKGTWTEPTVLRAVTDAQGKLLATQKPATAKVASARSTALSVSVLQTVMSEGTASKAASYGAVGAYAGKTGTTDRYRDAWFVGFSPDLVVVVWVGFDAGKEVGLTGGKAALPAWARFMASLGAPRGGFALSSDLIEAEYCAGEFVDGVCEACVTELFVKGQEPQAGCAPGLLDRIMDQTRGVRDPPAHPSKADKAKAEPRPQEKKQDKKRRFPWL